MIGILIATGAVIVTFLLKGVSPAILINLPSISIVFAGTFGATIASFGLAEFKKLPKLLGIAMKASIMAPESAVNPVGSLKTLLTMGTSVTMPINPRTTLGIAAKSSMPDFKISLTRAGATSSSTERVSG